MAVTNIFHDYIAGAVGGCAGIVVGHPFDTVKVQLQTRSAGNQFTSLSSCIKTVHNQDLSKGFFRGLSWPLLSYGAINSVYFGVYGKSLSWFVSDKEGTKSYQCMFLAGSVAGLAQLVIACPIDVIKVVLQSQIPRNSGIKLEKYYSGPLDAARDILRVRGIPGLYRGLGTQVCRDIPASGVYMMMYEYIRSNLSVMFKNVPSQIINFVSGGTAGVCSWLLILPLDVVKSRLQADTERKEFHGFLNCVSKSYKEGGIKVFLRGATMLSIRAFPVNAVTLMTYSECLKLLNNRHLVT